MTTKPEHHNKPGHHETNAPKHADSKPGHDKHHDQKHFEQKPGQDKFKR